MSSRAEPQVTDRCQLPTSITLEITHKIAPKSADFLQQDQHLDLLHDLFQAFLLLSNPTRAAHILLTA